MSITIKLNHVNIAVLNYVNMNNNPSYKCITSINVPKLFRRKGVGHRLLSQFCELADKEHFTIFVYIIPSRDISKFHIINMLKKHKFELINAHTMCRRVDQKITNQELETILNKYEME